MGDRDLRVVGRLLSVATAAGILIGGFTGMTVVGWDQEWTGSAFFLGATIGMFASPVVQVVNAFALFWLRRLRPQLQPAALRLALVPLPTLAAALVAFVALAALKDVAGLGLLASTAVSAGLTAVTAWLAAPWCLVPLSTTAG